MNCAGFSGDPAEKLAFVGDDATGCVLTCNQTPAVINLINPDNCGQTIQTLKGVSPDFADVCDNGFDEVPLTCATGCGVIYDCGVENMNCPGFTGDPAEKLAFVGDAEGGCIQSCNDQPALLNLIQTDNCAGTIQTLEAVSLGFADACENGFAAGGGAP
jgi:hypothetical protein